MNKEEKLNQCTLVLTMCLAQGAFILTIKTFRWVTKKPLYLCRVHFHSIPESFSIGQDLTACTSTEVTSCLYSKIH